MNKAGTLTPCPAGWPPWRSNDPAAWEAFLDYVATHDVRFWRTQKGRLRKIVDGLRVVPEMALVGTVPGTWEPGYYGGPGDLDFWVLGRRASYHLGSGEVAPAWLYGTDVLEGTRRALAGYRHLRWWAPRTILRLDRRDVLDTSYLSHPGAWPEVMADKDLVSDFFGRVVAASRSQPLPPGTLRETP